MKFKPIHLPITISISKHALGCQREPIFHVFLENHHTRGFEEAR